MLVPCPSAESFHAECGVGPAVRAGLYALGQRPPRLLHAHGRAAFTGIPAACVDAHPGAGPLRCRARSATRAARAQACAARREPRAPPRCSAPARRGRARCGDRSPRCADAAGQAGARTRSAPVLRLPCGLARRAQGRGTDPVTACRSVASLHRQRDRGRHRSAGRRPHHVPTSPHPGARLRTCGRCSHACRHLIGLSLRLGSALPNEPEMMQLTPQHLAAGRPRSHTLDLHHPPALSICIASHTSGTAARTISTRQHGTWDGPLSGSAATCAATRRTSSA
ncbi:hypothetical protein EDD91_7849 [Streptomyces sp. KS 21]|nr:hypothetical protein EDD91_7849 [Streptomyces sp. KS 21]